LVSYTGVCRTSRYASARSPREEEWVNFFLKNVHVEHIVRESRETGNYFQKFHHIQGNRSGTFSGATRTHGYPLGGMDRKRKTIKKVSGPQQSIHDWQNILGQSR